MRNLKRALSLALASVMLLGMMVVGTSAASYPDVDENDNVEAIEVLNAVGVMIGDRGNFRPDAAVNRHEMAAITARLLLGEDAETYVGNHPFTDVYPWADKYVAACYEYGVINGTSKTTYSGNQPLTAVQAAAIMLRALGYEDLTKGATDWRAPIVKQANLIQLFKGVASSPNAQLNRNQVAQLALNTLKSTVVVTHDNKFEINADNVTVDAGQPSYEEIRLDGEGAKNYAGAGNTGAGTQQLCEKLYGTKLKMTTGVSDDFGRPAVKWTYENKNVVAAAEDADLVYTKAVKLSDIYKDLGKPNMGGKTVSYVVDNAGQADPTLSSTNDTKVGAKGARTEVYKLDSGDVVIVTINTYLVKASADYNAKDEKLSVIPYGVTLSTSKIANEDVAVSQFKKDDMILVTGVIESGKLVIKTAEPATLVENVKVSAFNTADYVTAGGAKYEYSAKVNYNPDSVLGTKTLGNSAGTADTYNPQKTTYTLVLDKYDYVIGVKKYSDEVTMDDILFVNEIAKNGFNYQAKVLFMDGTTDTITIAGTKKVGGTEFKAMSAEQTGVAFGTLGTTLANDGELYEKRFYEFNKKSNGEYELQDIANTRQFVSAACSAGDKTIDSGKVRPIASAWTSGNPTSYVAKTANDSTIFIAKETVYTGVKNAPEVVAGSTTPANAQVYYLLDKDANYILAAYTKEDGTAVSANSDWVYVLESKGSGKDENEKSYNVLTVFKDGEKVTDYQAKGSTGTGLYEIKKSEDGYPKLGSALTTADTTSMYVNVSGISSNAITYKSGVVNAGTGLKVNTDTVVYVIDKDDKSGSTIDATAVETIDPGTYEVYAIYVSTSDNIVKTLWLVKTDSTRTITGTQTGAAIEAELAKGPVKVTGNISSSVNVGDGTLVMGSGSSVTGTVTLGGGTLKMDGGTMPTVAGSGTIDVAQATTIGANLDAIAAKADITVAGSIAADATDKTTTVSRNDIVFTGDGNLGGFGLVLGDKKASLYAFKVTGLDASTSYSYVVKASTDGTTYANIGAGATGSDTTDASGNFLDVLALSSNVKGIKISLQKSSDPAVEFTFNIAD